MGDLKVLLVSHNYVPAHSAGTEIYTAQLARRLADHGHEVSVFTTEKDISTEHLSTRERVHDGIEVTELVNNLFYASFRETWDHPAIDEIFGEHLDRVRPDVVHFHHLLYLSVGCVEECSRRKLPVLFTLHDYWLQCARFGQLRHADGSICDEVEVERCATCLQSFKYRQSPLQERVGRALAGIRSTTQIDLAPFVRGTVDWFASRGGNANEGEESEVDSRALQAMAGEVELRGKELLRRLSLHVDRFLSPSRFLAERMIEWGVSRDRIEHLATGMDLEAPRERAESEELRVAFIGTLIPVKGPHVLLDAWARLSEGARASATLSIFGPDRHHPEYQAQLRELASRAGARLAGELSREGVAAELARTDLLVVPSIWFENAPLVCFEALIARTPLLVSDRGGLAEIVCEGETGYHFRLGDAADLARKLDELIADRRKLDALFAQEVHVPTVEEQVNAIEARYAAVLSEKSAS